MEAAEQIETRGELAVMDQTGDTKLVWDRNAPAEVEQAKAMFDGLKKKGYLAFSVKKDGEAGEMLLAFDPNAEKIIMSPPLKGG